MSKYRKKPVEIEAIQWLGDNFYEIGDFMKISLDALDFRPVSKSLIIHTLEGDMTASCGDYIIKGVHGEFYPCKPGIFNETYEKVEENNL